MKDFNRSGNMAGAFWLAVVLLCVIIGAGCPQRALPAPTSEGGRVGASFVAEYRSELASVFTEAAKEVKAGRIATDAELLEYLQKKSEAARIKASGAIGVFLESRLSNGQLTSKDAEPLDELASGIKGAF